MGAYRKVGASGLRKKKWDDGNVSYSGKVTINQQELPGNSKIDLYINVAKSEKRSENSPDLWCTIKIKDDGSSMPPSNPQPPVSDEQEDIPF